MKLHIVYTGSETILSKCDDADWHEIQNKYEHYKTSLGPWNHEDVIDFLVDEYPEIKEVQSIVLSFVNSEDEETLLN